MRKVFRGLWVLHLAVFRAHVALFRVFWAFAWPPKFPRVAVWVALTLIVLAPMREFCGYLI